MSLGDYEAFVLAMRKYRGRGHNITYPVLALAGEAGELANELKKVLRGDRGPWSEGFDLPAEAKKNMLLELGDVVWYATAVAWELGSDLATVMDMNKEKLTARVPELRDKANL